MRQFVLSSSDTLRVALAALFLFALVESTEKLGAQVVTIVAVDATRIILQDVPGITFPGGTDSNSPAFWDLLDGAPILRVINSAGHPYISQARQIGRWTTAVPVQFTTDIGSGRWMEAVLQDGDGTLYGYYHNEPPSICGDGRKSAPRIGAARSYDGGSTWDDLGIVLEAPPALERCDTPNHYFYGGVGDFSVVLNREETDAYVVFSAYAGPRTQQGIGIARLPWHHRDDPVGNVAVWDGFVFRYPESDETGGLIYPSAGPIYPASISWHDPTRNVDALWGPSIHWNTHIQKYVMLLNRARNSDWAQEGIYLAFAATLDDPSAWTKPAKILDGGAWYPQVLGLSPGEGTDKHAGRVARLFVGGRSDKLIVFLRPDEPVPTAVIRGIAPD